MNNTPRWSRRLLPACLALALLFVPAAQGQTPSRVVAIGDVHGAYSELVALLQRARLIDARLKWIGGTAVLVQTGDVIDRGAQSRQCLDLLIALEGEAQKKGGAVIALLGNHEVMNLMGQLGYVTPEMFKTFARNDSEKRRQQAHRDFLKFMTAHDAHGHSVTAPANEAERTKWMDEHPVGFFEHREAFGPKGKYGRWIRTRHVATEMADGVFLHGGVSPSFDVPSVRQLDDRVMAELPAFDEIWKTLVDRGVIWRYMTFSEALAFTREEAVWLRTASQPPAPATDLAMRRLIDLDRWMVAGFPEGPLWYRGLSDLPEEELLDGLTTMLARFRARYMVVGHTPQANGQIVARFGSRVYLIDTGMLTEVYKGRPTALEIQNGRFTALSVDGSTVELPAPPALN